MKLFFIRWLPPFPLVFPAVLSGVLLFAAFEPVALGAASFFALVPLHAALFWKRWTRSEAFRAGFLFGLIFFFLLLWWIVKLLPWANVTIPWLMTPALLILTLYLALYPAFYCLLLVTLSRGKKAAGFLLMPALWILIEIARSRGELAFTWGAVGYGLTRHVNFIQSASWVGLFGIGFIVVLVNALFVLALLSRNKPARIVLLLSGAAIVAAMGLHGWKVVSEYSPGEGERGVVVAVIQPNVSLEVKWKPEFEDSTFLLIDRLAKIAASAGAELIVFPETSAPVYIRHDKGAMSRLQLLSRAVNTPIYIGFLDARRDDPTMDMDVYNSSGLFLPDGSLRMYDKTHLLPFGEALPLSWKWRFLKKINFGQANFQRGNPAPPVESPLGALAPLICFESIFPEISRRFVREGAGLLINITNDGWFGSTPGPLQHAEMGIYRAVENRRYMVRSANSGVSMVVDPMGRVMNSIEVDREGMLIEKVYMANETTFYTRFGEWPVLIVSLLFGIIGIVLGRWRD
ncbi:MAG: apolipoprotein N-acyltransferase [Candidatus Latescibacterota bacterium]